MTLREWTAKITPPDAAAMEEARRRQAQLAKPPGSLGRLEDLSVQLAGITGRVHNKIEKKHLLVFAADNGGVDEGVSSAPRRRSTLRAARPARRRSASISAARSPSATSASQRTSAKRRCYAARSPTARRISPAAAP